MIPVGTTLRLRELPRATLILIGANFLIFIIEALLPEAALHWVFRNFGFGPTVVNPIAPFTSMFLHGSVCHVVFNMLFLWIFGGPVEERIGSKPFVVYYLCAGVASAVLYSAMEALARGSLGLPSIGASGAVSGVMAIYVYRCFYSRMKMVIHPLLLPVKVNIPAAPLIILWFLRDILGGIASFSAASGVAHWAHVGGFVFGIGVAGVKRYGLEARVEYLREKINRKLKAGGGWAAAEKELLKLHDAMPEDAEVLHDLARLYVNREKHDQASRYYAEAVQRYFVKDPFSAACVVAEHAEVLKKPLPIQHHLRAAEIFIDKYLIEDAHKALYLPLREKQRKGQVTERALALFVMLSLDLGRKKQAAAAMELFKRLFPESRHLAAMEKAEGARPGEIFAHKRPAEAAPPSREEERAGERKGRGVRALAGVMEALSEPLFLFSWVVVNIIAYVFLVLGMLPRFLSENFFSLGVQLLVLVLSALLAVEHRLRLVMRLLDFSGRPSEKEALRGFELKRSLENAQLAEREERFTEAAGLFEEYVVHEPKNLQARFSLARLYHNHLDDAGKALGHYKALIKLIEPGTPYYEEVVGHIRELSKAGSAPP